MKKIVSIIVGLLLMGSSAWAKPVDVATARRVADTYMRAMGMSNTAALADVTAQTPFTEFYIFAAEESGFILVSGDDCVKPILGYSLTSRFEVKDIPEHVLDWLQGYEEEIRKWKVESGKWKVEFGRGVHPCTPVVSSEWTRLMVGEDPEPQWETSVSPLMTTTWNQEPYYNNLCPYHSGTSARSVTGCVATATTQIMKYHNHPTTGYGSHTYTSSRIVNGVTYTFSNLSADFGSTTYQWSSMPNALSGSSSSTQVNAVATLMYHIGVGVEMKYSPLLSGASNYYIGAVGTSAQAALMTYFKYRPDMFTIARADYSDAAFSTLLQNELDQDRPILYSGADPTGGHSFVLDGYNNSGHFHVNWGWGGYCDGYYVIGSLNPSGGGTGANNGTYNLNNVALLGIQPNSDWSTTGTTTVNATSGVGGTVSGGGSYAFGDTVTLEVTANTGYRFSGWSDGSKSCPREFVATGGSYTFTANFEPVSGDTLHYCPGNYNINSYGSYSTTTTWGIKLPASLLPSTSDLTAVQLYVTSPGSYNLTVYSGASHSTTEATVDVTYSSTDVDQWKTIPLSTPVVTSQDLWIVFNTTASYPASYTYGSGVAESFLWGTGLYEDGIYWGVTAMIKGIFGGGGGTPGGGEGGGCTVTTFPYSEDFEGSLDCWSAIDNNSDASTWRALSSIGSGSDAVTPHGGGVMMGSFSWNSSAMNADEYLVSPAIELPATGSYSLSFWFRVNGSWPEDKLAVKISTTGSAVNDFTTTLVDITPTSANGDWTQQTLDLSAYAGQAVYLAFHHHDSYDANYIVIDDLQITAEEVAPPTQYTLTVTSNNPAWGTVTGSGTYNEGATATLTATANSGYHFVSWQDGNTNATRTVTVTGNATYTATFEANPPTQYTITVTSNNPAWGTVTGSGTYNEGATATLTATANSGYRFVSWQDGNTNASRTITVTGNATYTATFAQNEGIEECRERSSEFGVFPNPASTTVTLSVGTQRAASAADITILDQQGRVVLTQAIRQSGDQAITFDVSTLPAGLYYVRMGTLCTSFIVSR